MKNSIPVYRTPTIVAAVTGTKRPSANVKTGPMLQLSILVSGVSPMDALRQGLDRIICGGCGHSSIANGGDGTCYVRVEQMPTAVWKSVKGQRIPDIDPADIRPGQPIRFGSYGDPGFLPLALLEAWTKGRKGWTGYSHQWRTLPIEYSQYLMASCETPADVKLANEKGWRAYRTIEHIDSPISANEILCPYVSKQGTIQCADCRLCSGSSIGAKSIVIPLHGGRFNRKKVA